jgi:hypothetical protein
MLWWIHLFTFSFSFPFPFPFLVEIYDVHFRITKLKWFWRSLLLFVSSMTSYVTPCVNLLVFASVQSIWYFFTSKFSFEKFLVYCTCIVNQNWDNATWNFLMIKLPDKFFGFYCFNFCEPIIAIPKYVYVGLFKTCTEKLSFLYYTLFLIPLFKRNSEMARHGFLSLHEWQA